MFPRKKSMCKHHDKQHVRIRSAYQNPVGDMLSPGEFLTSSLSPLPTHGQSKSIHGFIITPRKGFRGVLIRPSLRSFSELVTYQEGRSSGTPYDLAGIDICALHNSQCNAWINMLIFYDMHNNIVG